MIGAVLLNGVQVHTTNERGNTPEELAARAADKIVYVGSNSHPAIRDQAVAFKVSVETVVLFYLKQSVEQDRATIAHKLRKAGYPDLVTLLGD